MIPGGVASGVTAFTDPAVGALSADSSVSPGTPFNVALPSIDALGDEAAVAYVAYLTHNRGILPSVPTGWVLLGGALNTHPNGSVRSGLYVASAGVVSSFSATWASGSPGTLFGVVSAVGGVDVDALLDAGFTDWLLGGHSPGTQDITVPSVDASRGTGMLLAMGTADVSGVATLSFTPPAGSTELFDRETTFTSGLAAAGCWRRVGTGATGATTMTRDQSGNATGGVAAVVLPPGN